MNDNLTIHAASIADAESLSLLGQSTFLESFAGILDGKAILAHCANAHSVAAYRNYLGDPAVNIWIAGLRPDQARGAASAIAYAMLCAADLPLADLSPDDLELKRLYILHRFHVSGLGRLLLNEAASCARQRGARRLLLGVYQGNDNAIGFYKRVGFQVIGTRRFNVGGFEYDDYVLSLDL